MAAIPQLTIYNKALDILGERPLASLTEAREPRRILDTWWDSGNVILRCLEEGMWKFALRTSKLSYDPSVTISFGYQFATAVPTDMVRIAQLCSDEMFNIPLTEYSFEAGMFYMNVQWIYLQYVSKDAAYGLNAALWPQLFEDYVAAYLAWRAALRITQSQDKEDHAEAWLKRAKDDALSKNAMAGPTQFLPQGQWVSARYGSGMHRDRGNRGSLYG